MKLAKGYRNNLKQLLNIDKDFHVEIKIDAAYEADICCFGIDEKGILSDDRYMIFYNQPISPGKEIELLFSRNAAAFRVNLAKLPPSVAKLVITINTDGTAPIKALRSGSIRIVQNNTEPLEVNLGGLNLQYQKSLIAIEFYKRIEWKIAAVLDGFNGGLSALLKNFGGVEITPTPQPSSTVNIKNPAQTQKSQAPLKTPEVLPVRKYIPHPTVQQSTLLPQNHSVKISAQVLSNRAPRTVQKTSDDKKPLVTIPGRMLIEFEKKLAPYPDLKALVTPFAEILKKRSLENIKAKIVLVIMVSEQMQYRYLTGTLQEILNRHFLAALYFYPSADMELWFYRNTWKKSENVTLANYTSSIPFDWYTLRYELGEECDSVQIITQLFNTYKNSDLPVLISFITDGNTKNDAEIKSLIFQAANFPIFWQFVGLEGQNYGVLERIDKMSGRIVDNAGFFALDDFKQVSDLDFFSRLFIEFPQWHKKATAHYIVKSIIPPQFKNQ